MEKNDFKIFEDAFVYDIPSDNVGFFMFAATGKPFYFSDLEGMRQELWHATEYAKCHGVKFDSEIVYGRLMEIQKASTPESNVYTGREKGKKKKRNGLDAA